MLKGKRKGDQRFLSRIISQEYWDISSATSLNYRFLTNFFLALDRGLTFKEIPFTGNILFLSSSFFFKQRWWEAEIRGKRYSININRDLKLNGRTWKLKSWICLFKKLARSFERWVGIYGGWSRNLQIYFGPSSVRAFLSRLIRKFRGPLRARIAVFAFNGVFFPGRRIPTEIGSSKPAPHNRANKNAKALMLELQLKKASLFDNLHVNFLFLRTSSSSSSSFFDLVESCSRPRFTRNRNGAR